MSMILMTIASVVMKGGCCKISGGDCPNKGSRIFGAAATGGQSSQERQNRVTKFTSGDDLEDDFAPVVSVAGKEEEEKRKNGDPKLLILLLNNSDTCSCGVGFVGIVCNIFYLTMHVHKQLRNKYQGDGDCHVMLLLRKNVPR